MPQEQPWEAGVGVRARRPEAGPEGEQEARLGVAEGKLPLSLRPSCPRTPCAPSVYPFSAQVSAILASTTIGTRKSAFPVVG